MTTKIVSAIQCNSEYETLKSVVTCKPSNMRISNVINETQKHFVNENIDVELALKQHGEFTKALIGNGVNIIELPANEKYPEQVFTRDIGFSIGNKLFVAEMSCGIRQGEEKILKKWLEEQNIPFHELNSAEIEGGDVIVDNKTIYVGIGDRTSLTSVEELASLVDEYEVIPIPFDSKYLHLDCIFNIISENEALIYSDAFMKNELELLSNRFELIEVNKTEQFTMGTNILSLGDKKIISLPVNENVNASLRDREYTVIEVDFSEIIKSGGSFRCCSMPLNREKN